MSRGQPQWSEHWRTVALPRQSAHGGGQQIMLHAKVTSRRRYEIHRFKQAWLRCLTQE